MHESFVLQSYTKDSHDFHHYSSHMRHSPKKSQRINISKRIPQREFRKARPPTFNRVDKMGQEVEAWLLGMKKYFQIYTYTRNKKAIISIYNLSGRA